MARTMACCYPSCIRKVKLNRNSAVQYEREMARLQPGASVGVICPQHVKDAILDEEDYALEMTAGEIIAELTVESPRWRFVHIPPGG